MSSSFLPSSLPASYLPPPPSLISFDFSAHGQFFFPLFWLCLRLFAPVLYHSLSSFRLLFNSLFLDFQPSVVFHLCLPDLVSLSSPFYTVQGGGVVPPANIVEPFHARGTFSLSLSLELLWTFSRTFSPYRFLVSLNSLFWFHGRAGGGIGACSHSSQRLVETRNNAKIKIKEFFEVHSFCGTPGHLWLHSKSESPPSAPLHVRRNRPEPLLASRNPGPLRAAGATEDGGLL